MKKLMRHRLRFKGLSLGLDLHKKVMQVSVFNEAGDEIENQQFRAEAQMLLEVVERLTQGGAGLQVALEASGCFLWAYDLLVEKLGREQVHVAAPAKVRVIAEAGDKTDEGDAWWLGYLLWDGRLPEAMVAQGELRELRIACREHRSVVEERSDLVRRMRSHLSQLGMALGKSDFKSVVGRQRITRVVEEVEKQEGVRGEAIARLWKRIQEMDQEVESWNGKVASLAKGFKEVAMLDQELAGVGPQLAAVVWSELGDPQRYHSAKAYAKATGLTPGYRESAGRRSKKAITREGSAHVRWALTRAVLACMRCRKGDGVWVRRWVEKTKRRKSIKAAIVAGARKLAEAVWRLFTLGEAFDLARAFGGHSAKPIAQTS
jgi:transposase